MKKFLKLLGILLIIGIIVYLLGPKPESPVFDLTVKTTEMSTLEAAAKIIDAESKVPNIRKGNSSQIVWFNDSTKEKTEYVLVYLHGFSASPEEGAPTHLEFATKYGCNFYAPRLHQHGLEGENAMINFSGEGFIQTAKEALIAA